jgi:hypothetical protein
MLLYDIFVIGYSEIFCVQMTYAFKNVESIRSLTQGELVQHNFQKKYVKNECNTGFTKWVQLYILNLIVSFFDDVSQ